MKLKFNDLRILCAKYLWISITFSFSIIFLVDLLMGIFVWNNFELKSSIVEDVIVGVIWGLINQKIC